MVPIPKPCFLDECEYLGVYNSKRRWRSTERNRLYEWDSLHGEIEVYNLRGRHVMVADALTGLEIKPAVKGRKIDV